MKSVYVVVVLASTVAGLLAQSSTLFATPEFETPSLAMWGVLLLVVGRLVKSRQNHRRNAAPARTPERVTRPVRAPARATR